MQDLWQEPGKGQGGYIPNSEKRFTLGMLGSMSLGSQGPRTRCSALAELPVSAKGLPPETGCKELHGHSQLGRLNNRREAGGWWASARSLTEGEETGGAAGPPG